MYEYLQDLFGKNEDGTEGSLTFSQLVSKLEDSKDIKLTNLSDGGYVSNEKYKAKETELAGVKNLLEQANSEIQSYKEIDVDGLKSKINDWETKYNNDTKSLTEQLAKEERNHGVDMFLSNYKFTSKAAKAGIRAEFDAKNFPYENGTFLGAKEFMESLENDDDYKGAFVTEAPAEVKEEKPKPEWSQPTPPETPPEKKPSLAELMKKKNDNPDAVIAY